MHAVTYINVSKENEVLVVIAVRIIIMMMIIGIKLSHPPGIPGYNTPSLLSAPPILSSFESI